MILNKIQSRVLSAYSSGASCLEIGETIGLSEHTVTLILTSASDVLEARNIAHATKLFNAADQPSN